MNNSVFSIIPAAHVAAANKLWELLGLGPNNYDVAFSSTGTGAPEFYGCNYENMPAHEESAVRALKTALPALQEWQSWGEAGRAVQHDQECRERVFGRDHDGRVVDTDQAVVDDRLDGFFRALGILPGGAHAASSSPD